MSKKIIAIQFSIFRYLFQTEIPKYVFGFDENDKSFTYSTWTASNRVGNRFYAIQNEWNDMALTLQTRKFSSKHCFNFMNHI